MAKRKRSFTINRGDWLNGTILRQNEKNGQDTESYLRRAEDGLMCCLGIGANQLCGVSKKALTGQSSPEDLISSREFRTPRERRLFDRLVEIGFLIVGTEEGDYEGNSKTVETLMQVNDNSRLKPSVRERRVKSLLKKLGITVRFVGKTDTALEKAARA